MVQMDPTSAVARTEHLVLFSRLGSTFRVGELERMLWRERSLFEYWVHIVPTSDFGVHRESMRRYPDKGQHKDTARRRYVTQWLTANASFRRYVLGELRDRGPLRSRDLEDRRAEGWDTGGWNDDRSRSVSMLLDLLWFKGEVMIVGRAGQQRLWDLAGRSLPVTEQRWTQQQVARRVLEGRLRASGVGTTGQFIDAFDGRVPGWERALRDLVREGVAVPARIQGIDKGEWYAHADVLAQPWRPRTVALSPFDDLVSDRAHTEALFDFFFRLEIYVPKAKRQWGYFVMPILHGDRLIGRIDPRSSTGGPACCTSTPCTRRTAPMRRRRGGRQGDARAREVARRAGCGPRRPVPAPWRRGGALSVGSTAGETGPWMKLGTRRTLAAGERREARRSPRRARRARADVGARTAAGSRPIRAPAD